MKLLVLLLTTGITSLLASYPSELEGSEGYQMPLEDRILGDFHPMLPHIFSPIIHHPYVQKLNIISRLKPKKETVTKTKTLILQTVRRENKHLVCYKANHQLPPCIPENREGDYILPTAVSDLPHQGQTQYAGTYDGIELREEEEQAQPPNAVKRDRRFLLGLPKVTEYVTKTLLVTKVEDYINTAVTATLVPTNCVPSHANIPPCPEKVEHYVHYESKDDVKPIIDNKDKLRHPENSGNSEGSNVKSERRTNDKILSSIDSSKNIIDIPVNENPIHLNSKKIEPTD